MAISFLKGLASLILPFLEYEIATPAFGGLAMTAREIVIARSEATKQSQREIATPAFGGLAMTKR